MTWVRVAGKNINLDAASRYVVQDKAGAKSITLHFCKDDTQKFKDAYAEELIAFLEQATKQIGPPESPKPEPTKKKSFAEIQRRKHQAQ
jgi:hypothetical protein